MSQEDLATISVSKLRQVGALVDLVRRMPSGDPRYALFLGAGASRSSGIPACGDLIKLWQRRLFLDETRLRTWRPHYEERFTAWLKTHYQGWKADWQATYGRQPSDYSLLFSYAYPDTDARQGFIEQLCSGCEPGPGYIYLASLVLAGYFQTFLTTNFDDLVHDSLFRYAGIKPIVCAFDSQVSSVRLQSSRPKIIKLHGDFLFTNIRNVGAETGHLDRNMEQKFERTCENYGLIVVGYGGCDQSIMAPLRAMLHRQDCLTHGLHWCVFSDAREARVDSVSIPHDLYRMWESYSEKVHLYEMGSFDEMMESFYFGCRCTAPAELAAPQERALYTRLRDGLENADQTWRLTASFSRLLGDFRRARALPPPQVLTLLDEADECHRIGLLSVKAGKLHEAEAAFREAVSKASTALDEANQIQKVRAYRRRSGSRGNLGEVFFLQAKNSGVPEAGSGELGQFVTLAKGACQDARDGIAIDQHLKAPFELRGHRLNLWFNGLIGYGYLIVGGAQVSDSELLEALSWLEGLTSDELSADEYLGFLAKELGGPELLEILRSLSEGLES